MIRFGEIIARARSHLPATSLARWASVLFTTSLFTLLISLAASQAFLAAAAVCYAAHVWYDRPAVRFPPIKLPLALFCSWTVVSMFFAENPAAGGFAIRKLALFVILLLTANVVISRKHLEVLYQALFLEATLAGLAGAAQFAAQYHAVRAAHPGRIYASMTAQRITGFMGHWMNFSGQQMLAFLALLAFLLLAPGAGKIGWGLITITAVSIVLSFTRGVWLGCFAGALYLVARWKPRWLLAVPALLLAGFLAAPGLVRERVALAFHPSRDPALSIRFEMWQAGMRMIQAHPFLGVGPNNIEGVYGLYLPPGQSPQPGYHEHLHNDFIQFAAERGLPCLAAWVWLMAALAGHAWRIRRRLAGGAHAWVADAALAAWLAFVVEGCFEFNFGTSPVLMVLLFLVSTPFTAERLEEAKWAEGSSSKRRTEN